MTKIKKLLMALLFISAITGANVYGEDLKPVGLNSFIRYKSILYYYKEQDVCKKDWKKTEKSDKEPVNFFIKTDFDFDFLTTDNASNYIKDMNTTNYCFFTFDIKMKDLKTYNFSFDYRGDGKLYKDCKVSYMGYTNGRYMFFMVLDVSHDVESLKKFESLYSVKIQLNNELYEIPFEKYFRKPYLAQWKDILQKHEEQQEAAYKNSSEYKKQVRQQSFEALIKNGKYNIKKDNFDDRIHVTSKRTENGFDKNLIGLLNKNNIFISPRCEIYSKYYSPDFGMTITQKSSMTKGSAYIQAIGFSNGDESVIVRLGNYGIGEVGKYINIDGFADAVQVTVRLGNSYADDLYNIMINAKKPVMVRVYAGEYSYETVISDVEKNMFIDILKIYQLEGFKD